VTRGALKNLVTDKPSPITVGLAQVSSKKDKKSHKKHSKKSKKPKNADLHQDDDDFRPSTMTLKGMEGIEVVHGNAVVGGSKVTYAQNAKQRITGTQDEDEKFIADLTIDGTKIHFAEKKQEVKAEPKKTEPEGPKSWVDANDKGDKDPEMKALRKKLKDGVLSYSSYMEHKHTPEN